MDWTPTLIKSFRTGLGLSQRELDDKLRALAIHEFGFSIHETIANLEAGKFPNVPTQLVLNELLHQSTVRVRFGVRWDEEEKEQLFAELLQQRLAFPRFGSSHGRDGPSSYFVDVLSLSFDESSFLTFLKQIAKDAGVQVFNFEVENASNRP